MKKIIVTNKNNKNLLNPIEMSFGEREQELKELNKLDQKTIEQEQKSNYTRWSQFNLEYTAELIWLASNHAKAHAILLYLIDNADKYNTVMCSYQVFEELLGVSRQTISTAIKVLKDNGFIYVYKSGVSNVYCINPDLFWKSYGKNVIHCKFPANIILSLKEQDKQYQKQFEHLKQVKQ